MAGRSIIIPRGTINPNQTNIIQIPEEYRNVQTLIARNPRGQTVSLQPTPRFDDLRGTSPPSAIYSSPPSMSASRSNMWSGHATPSDYMSLPDPFVQHSTYPSVRSRAASMPPSVHLSQFESQRRTPGGYSRNLRPEFESSYYPSQSNSRSYSNVSGSMASQHVSLPNPQIYQSTRASRLGRYGSLPQHLNRMPDSPIGPFDPVAASSFKSLGPSTELYYDDTHWPSLSTWDGTNNATNNNTGNYSAEIQIEKTQSHPSLGVITTNSKTNVQTRWVPVENNVSTARSLPRGGGGRAQMQNKMIRSAGRPGPTPMPLQRPPPAVPAAAGSGRPMGRVCPRARTPAPLPTPPPAQFQGGTPIPSVHTSHITQGSRGGETYSAGGGTFSANGTFSPMGNCHRPNCYCGDCCGTPPPPCACAPQRR